MANAVLFISSMSPGNGGRLNIAGEARLDDNNDNVIAWNVDVRHGDLAITMNDAIVQAAIAAANDVNRTIGPFDRKTLFAGAMSR